MTDKQMIIDGVDVSECEYYDKNKQLLTCVCEEYPCSECHNCYYKQLQRKEQKLDKIKEYCKPKVMMNGTANVILQIIEGKDND